MFSDYYYILTIVFNLEEAQSCNTYGIYDAKTKNSNRVNLIQKCEMRTIKSRWMQKAANFLALHVVGLV